MQALSASVGGLKVAAVGDGGVGGGGGGGGGGGVLARAGEALAALEAASVPAFDPEAEALRAEHGVGGSETAVIEVSKRLAAMGHQVRVIADCGKSGVHDGVWWLPLTYLGEIGECDVAVAWRNLRLVDQFEGAGVVEGDAPAASEGAREGAPVLADAGAGTTRAGLRAERTQAAGERVGLASKLRIAQSQVVLAVVDEELVGLGAHPGVEAVEHDVTLGDHLREDLLRRHHVRGPAHERADSFRRCSSSQPL
jgi:hypothetical protein